MAAADMHSAIELSVGGGWSTLGYKVQPLQPLVSGNNSGTWGLQAHIGYAFFFTPNVGLGIGADFSHYGAQATLNGTARWEDVTDTEGEHYNHLALIHSLRDKQEIFFVEIPVTFYFAYPVTYSLDFNMQLGAKYGIPLLSKASFQADIEHQGDYGIWGLNLHDVPGHGFYRENDFHGDYQVAAQSQISVFLKLGLDYAVRTNIHLFGNIYGVYGLMNALKSGQTELGFQNDRQGMQTTHAFMAAYDGITATNNISAQSHPIQVGLELGVRFVFPHKKSYPCRCKIY
jgi:hypothetical protein